MEKKILIAVDGSASTNFAVDYVGLMEGAMVKELKRHPVLCHERGSSLFA